MKAGSFPPVVLTGATGFLGQRVLHLLAQRGAPSVRVVARRATALARGPQWRPGWTAVDCDLAASPLPDDVVTAGSVVLHLAAATGKATPEAMRAVNVEGTRRVVDAARAGGAAHLIFVSSIAASFRDQRWYHYAHAKLEAESIVASSGVPCSIVRPTMIFGDGSPIQAALTGLANGGAPIVLGSGEVLVQPIHVDDLAAFLVALAGDDPSGTTPMEVGGGERLTMRALLARVRAASGLKPRSPVGVPLALLRAMLGAAERVVGTALPITAGQLASFVNDSAAVPNPLVARLLPAPRGVDAMLVAEAGAPPLAGHSSGAAERADPAALAHEFSVFARYLGTVSVDERLAAAYVRAHQSLPPGASDGLDAWLFQWGRSGTVACTLSDCYARRVRPFGLLRRKLVLALAVLESMPATHARYDTARHASATASWLALVALGVRWVACTVAAVVVLLPVHFLLSLRGARASTGHG
ncbi:MAG: NAD(P)H-binding protein [Gemmatimonadaceae bacterium]|nr:NAD(P)H-binding protein [Gemmatimonadaceae bacterium]